MAKKKPLNPLTIPLIGMLVVVIALLVTTGVQAYRFSQLMNDTADLRASFATLSESLTRAQSERVSASELKDKINGLITDNQVLKEDLRELRARPTSVTQVIASTGEEATVVWGGSEDTESGGDKDVVPLELQYRTPGGLLVAKHFYQPDVPSFEATTMELRVESDTVVSTTRKGAVVSHTQLTITSSGDPTPVNLEITEANVTYVSPQDRIFQVAPHLNIGLSVGGDFVNGPAGLVGANGGISIFAWGRTESDNTLRFLNIRGEVGYRSGINTESGNLYGGVGIDPVLVNVGEPLPLLSDLYLGAGPTLTVYGSPDKNGPPQVGFGITFGITSTL